MEIHRQETALSLSLIRESQKATDATENVDEMTQLDCAILHAVCQCERRRRRMGDYHDEDEMGSERWARRVANGTTMGDALYSLALRSACLSVSVCLSVMPYLDHFRSSIHSKNDQLNYEHVRVRRYERRGAR